MNRHVKTLDVTEERMQSANKVYWRDIQVFRSKDVPWRIKCGRLVDHVYSVFSLGSENSSWTVQTMDKKQEVGDKDNHAFSFQKEGRMKYGSNSIKDAAKRPERFRDRWS